VGLSHPYIYDFFYWGEVMERQLFGIVSITPNGSYKEANSSDKNEWHDDMVYKEYKNEIDKLGVGVIKYYENDKYTGLWPRIAALTKYYSVLTIIENFMYNINVAFIPENVTPEQIQTFKRLFSNDIYKDFIYGDKTIVDGNFEIVFKSHKQIEDMIELLESKNKTNLIKK